MSLESIRKNVLGIQEALAVLEAEIEQNIRARSRAVAIKAKNLTPGDVIEWPYGLGKQPVNYVTKWADRVSVTADRGSIPFADFDPDQRVRVYR